MVKKQKENKEPEYNGWVVLLLIIAIFSSTDWHTIAVLLIIVIYVIGMEYLKMCFNMRQ